MKKNVKVLQIIHELEPPFELVAKSYAESFFGGSVTTIVLKGERDENFCDEIYGEVYFLELSSQALKGFKVQAILKVMSLLRTISPNIVIGHRYKPFFIAVILNYFFSLDAVFGVVHHYGFLDRKSRRLFSRFWKENVELIAVSNPVCDYLKQRVQEKKEKIHLVQQAYFKPILLTKKEALKFLSLPDSNYYFGAIGRLVEKKNHQFLIEAFSKINDDSNLIIIGDGRLSGELKAIAKDLGIERRVHFLGQVEMAHRYLKAFDCFIFPSTEKEEFGIVLLEAMFAELPIICSDSPGPMSIAAGFAHIFRSGDQEQLTTQMRSIRKKTTDELSNFTKAGLKKLEEDCSQTKMFASIRSLPPVAKLLSKV
ncbi:MAG: glycosyltransferase [Candidatus Azotimanducaceae bacterium]